MPLKESEKGSVLVCGPEEGQHLPDGERGCLSLLQLFFSLSVKIPEHLDLFSNICIGPTGDKVESLGWLLRR